MEFLKESVDYAIFFILGLMGFVSIWLTIERVMFLRKVNPSDYPTKDEYDAALTNNLTTLYIIYSNALRSMTWASPGTSMLRTL